MSLDLIKQLREITGAGIADCKKALQEANNNLDKAVEVLRKKGQKVAAIKQGRTMRAGAIGAYVHANNKIGVLVEVTCETDFVAKNQEFLDFIHELALQVAAANPKWLLPEEVPVEVIEKEKEICREELKKEGKPAAILDKIIEGRIQKFFNETCLIKQAFIKDDKITIEDLLKEKILKIGENIKIQKFCRFSL